MTHLEDGAQDLMGYESLVQEAMQDVMRKALTRVAESGFPGKHHLYVIFRTDQPKVVIPKRLLTQFPEEMTIVLQNQFWELEVGAAGFSVLMSFGGVPERLFIPFAAVKTFFDPSVSFGLQFKLEDAGEDDFLDTVDFFENVIETEEEEEQNANPKTSGVGNIGQSSDKILDLEAFRRKKGL